MKIAFKIFISFGLVAWFLMISDLGRIGKSLWCLKPITLVTAITLYCCAIIVASIKWRQLLPAYSLPTLIAYSLIGQYYSVLLPGQMAGELMKTYKLGKGKKDAEMIAASVVIDKMTSLVGLLLLGITGLILSRSGQASSFTLIFVGLLLILLILLFCLRIKAIDSRVRSFLSYLAVRFSILGRYIYQVDNLITAWQDYLYKPKLLFSNIILGVVFQCIAILIIKVLATSMGIELSFQDWCWIFSLVSVAVLIPITIGSGTGIRESCFVIILSWFAIPKEKALALSFAIFGVMLVGVLIGAFLDWFMIDSGRSE